MPPCSDDAVTAHSHNNTDWTDFRTATDAALFADVTAHGVVAAGKPVVVTQAAEDLHGGVPLLAWRVLIGGEDGVDEGMKGAQDGSGRPCRRVYGEG